MAVSNESSLKPLLYEHTQLHDSPNDDLFQFSEMPETEDDDALSLCDLPIYSSSNSSSDLNRGEYQEEANTVFEFVSFSEELRAGQSCKSDDSAIIFCGKLVAYKDVAAVNNQTAKSRCEKLSPRHVGDPKKPRKRSLFSWKRFKIASFRSKSASKKKPSSSSSHESSYPSQELSSTSPKKNTKTRRLEKMPSAKKVLTSPTKSRWYLFMFGQTRFPQAMTMELSDLKNRQRRLCSPSPSMNLRAEVGGSSRGRGIWSLLKESVTTVSRTRANDVVRAVGCISLV
ncbi:hypothetical protein QQ045_024204 [Rhodiola kirilowii]